MGKVMTWGEFKDVVERQGLTDADKLDSIFVEPNTDSVITVSREASGCVSVIDDE